MGLSSVIGWPIHIFNASCEFKKNLSKKFNQKIYLGKNLPVAVIYLGYGHTSLKRETIFDRIAIFATTKTTLMSVNKK